MPKINNDNFKKNTKRLGIIAFLFFLIKGLLWIAAAYYGISLFTGKAKSANSVEIENKAEVKDKDNISGAANVAKEKAAVEDIRKVQQRALSDTLPVEVFGSENAPVKITAFLSISCGFCRKEYLEDIPRLLDGYVKSGKVQIMIYHYPIDESAVELEMILSRLETQEALNKKLELFKHQMEWLEPYYNNDKEKAIAKISQIIGMDSKKIKETLKDEGLKDAVIMKNIMLEGKFKGLDGTPYFIINGKVYDHGLRFKKLKEIIDSIINKKI